MFFVLPLLSFPVSIRFGSIRFDPLHSIAVDNLQLLQGDGTFETVSQMIFTATRFENSAVIQCEADNIVMRNDMEKPLHQSINLEVMCKQKNENRSSALPSLPLHLTLLWCFSENWKNVLSSISRKLNCRFNEITRRNAQTLRAAEEGVEMGQQASDIRNQFFNLSIFFSTFCFLSLHLSLDPPVVIVKPDNLTINETGEFLLFCEYDANPASLASVRWLQNNSVLNLNQSRFDGGNPEQTALLVKNATRDDRGAYSCELTNQVGTGTSENGVIVDVQC
jgi:Immunoglobulin domain